MAGSDAEFRKRLERFQDENAFATSYRSLEQKLSSGEYRPVTPYPDKGTPQQQAAWCAERGIPTEASHYKIQLQGIVPGEADKPMLESFAKHAHERRWSNEIYNQAADWYYKEVDNRRAAIEKADADYRIAAEDTLRADWGTDYRKNHQIMQNFVAGLPEDVRNAIVGGRGPDGRPLGDNAALIKWMTQLHLDLTGGHASILAEAGSGGGKGVDARLNEISAMRRNDPDGFERLPNVKDIRAEELRLLEVRQRQMDRQGGKAA